MTRTSGDGPKRAYVIGPFGDGTRAATRPHEDLLPYGAHLLTRHGYEVAYSDPAASLPVRVARLGRLISAVHRFTRKPVLAPVLEPARLARADLLVCIFEDNLVAVSALVRLRRLLRGGRNRRSVLVVCWLAEDLTGMTNRERRRWRRQLIAFDRVVVFSSNQIDLLQERLRLPAGLVDMVPFGVTVPPAQLAPLDRVADPARRGAVVAVGTDRGRDFDTFVAALRDYPAPVTIVTNAEHARRLRNVGQIEVIGPIDHASYLTLLRAAEVVVSPTHALAYPTGQTVLVESMALAKACVVTRSAALDDYVTDEVEALLIPAHDPAALRAAVERLQTDPALQDSLGRAAARAASAFTEEKMWAAIVRASIG